ncbi:hypothetical protein BDA99DRAFT_539119 [Phascolomyces articulosus]|uniref:Uncharacterized protein n=1 Tax=Phascolomyces articulosus TaxID=60185 RepID=A0AAD5JWP0_9FUNG|nr:hypothetical protein BDA99DRAFT_539119 [Phascolomyces articulosus]
MVIAEEPRSFAEIEGWISTLGARIRESIQTHSGFSTLYDDMINNDMLPQHTQEDQNQFVVLSQEHHVFEHFLRTMKFELAKEKHSVLTILSPNDPQREISLNTIEDLEQTIQDYLVTHGRAFCRDHPNHDAEEGFIVIESEDELADITRRSDQEEAFQQSHRDQVERLRNNN